MLVRILNIHEKEMNKANGNKIKEVKKNDKHGRVTFLMLIFLLRIHDVCLPERVCVILPAVMKILLWPVEK